MKARPAQAIPTLAMTLVEAAAALGVSLSTFRRHILPGVKAVKVGNAVVISAAELSRWLDANGTLGQHD